MRGKMILIEGTDCSGKETQSKLLEKYLNDKGIKTVRISFPDYDSPTGKIVGGPYLGKSYICEGWFPEKATNVDPKVSALYYAADRLYHKGELEKTLNSGKWIILDRYVYSNVAHQGGKERNKEKRLKLYEWLTKLEFELCELPDPDFKIFLHMPYTCSIELRKGREEAADQNEASPTHLKNSERAYVEIADLYNFHTIPCNKGKKIRSIEDISKDVIECVEKELK